jgi:transcriptional regulator with XRE-family HTH domain
MTRQLQPEGEVFGQRLRDVRQRLGVTQEALSLSSGLTQAYISDMERGLKVPSLTTILRLAVALQTKVMDLVGVFDKTDLPSILPK